MSLDILNYKPNLPQGWEEKVSPDGQVIYTDNSTMKTQLCHPLTGKRKKVVTSIPSGWERVQLSKNNVIYLNKEEKNTCNFDPRLALVLEEKCYAEDIKSDSVVIPFKSFKENHPASNSSGNESTQPSLGIQIPNQVIGGTQNEMVMNFTFASSTFRQSNFSPAVPPRPLIHPPPPLIQVPFQPFSMPDGPLIRDLQGAVQNKASTIIPRELGNMSANNSPLINCLPTKPKNSFSTGQGLLPINSSFLGFPGESNTLNVTPYFPGGGDVNRQNQGSLISVPEREQPCVSQNRSTEFLPQTGNFPHCFPSPLQNLRDIGSNRFTLEREPVSCNMSSNVCASDDLRNSIIGPGRGWLFSDIQQDIEPHRSSSHLERSYSQHDFRHESEKELFIGGRLSSNFASQSVKVSRFDSDGEGSTSNDIFSGKLSPREFRNSRAGSKKERLLSTEKMPASMLERGFSPDIHPRDRYSPEIRSTGYQRKIIKREHVSAVRTSRRVSPHEVREVSIPSENGSFQGRIYSENDLRFHLERKVLSRRRFSRERILHDQSGETDMSSSRFFRDRIPEDRFLRESSPHERFSCNRSPYYWSHDDRSPYEISRDSPDQFSSPPSPLERFSGETNFPDRFSRDRFPRGRLSRDSSPLGRLSRERNNSRFYRDTSPCYEIERNSRIKLPRDNCAYGRNSRDRSPHLRLMTGRHPQDRLSRDRSPCEPSNIKFGSERDMMNHSSRQRNSQGTSFSKFGLENEQSPRRRSSFFNQKGRGTPPPRRNPQRTENTRSGRLRIWEDSTPSSSEPKKDQWWVNMIENIKNHPGRYPLWKIENNILFRWVRSNHPWKEVVPIDSRTKVIAECHEGHLNRQETLQKVQGTYFWPGLAADIRDFIKNCPICNINNPE